MLLLSALTMPLPDARLPAPPTPHLLLIPPHPPSHDNTATPSPHQNEEAEELMRRVESAEDDDAAARGAGAGAGARGSGGGGGHLHLAIINLVIGTLYCSKVGQGSTGFRTRVVIQWLPPFGSLHQGDDWWAGCGAWVLCCKGWGSPCVYFLRASACLCAVCSSWA